MQKETLASGENILCPKMYFEGSFSHPNIAAKMHRYTPIKNTTLFKEL